MDSIMWGMRDKAGFIKKNKITNLIINYIKV